jgi:hypothetical protein
MHSYYYPLVKNNYENEKNSFETKASEFTTKGNLPLKEIPKVNGKLFHEQVKR